MDKHFRYFRMLQILLNRYQEAYGSVFIPNATLFVTANIILGIYGVVKLHDQMILDKFMNFPIMVAVMVLCLFTLWPKNATIYERTKDEASRRSFRMSLGAGETRLREKEMRCVLRSCPALGVPFGTLYRIKRSTVLSLFDFVARNTISALITYP